jgi:hypothetical protein
MSADYGAMLAVAIEEARMGLAEGGIPIGAALFNAAGQSWDAATIGACRKTTLRFTAKPTPFARQAASRPTGTRSW